MSHVRPKIQRLMDLTAALLRRRYSITFEELRRDVPAYAEAPSQGAMMRMFERDKDELRALGIPIRTVPGEDSESTGYLLRRKDFYLPYIVVERSGAGGGAAERAGYRDLPRVVLAADERAMIDAAALRVRQLGDPVLARHADGAIRKLAFDLPHGTFTSIGASAEPPAATRIDVEVVERLELALRSRKRVSFAYRETERGRVERREVEPYGLIFVGDEWYLAARDPAHGALRRFRLEWIHDVEVNRKREQSPDYELPAGLDMGELARCPWPWERGEGECIDVVVMFRSTDGACAAAARLGEPVSDRGDARRFRVRRLLPFVRWLIALGGDAVPIAPRELVAEYRGCVRRMLARYDGGSARRRAARGRNGASAHGQRR